LSNIFKQNLNKPLLKGIFSKLELLRSIIFH